MTRRTRVAWRIIAHASFEIREWEDYTGRGTELQVQTNLDKRVARDLRLEYILDALMIAYACVLLKLHAAAP